MSGALQAPPPSFNWMLAKGRSTTHSCDAHEFRLNDTNLSSKREFERQKDF